MTFIKTYCIQQSTGFMIIQYSTASKIKEDNCEGTRLFWTLINLKKNVFLIQHRLPTSGLLGCIKLSHDHICKLCIYYTNYTIIYVVWYNTCCNFYRRGSQIGQPWVLWPFVTKGWMPLWYRKCYGRKKYMWNDEMLWQQK